MEQTINSGTEGAGIKKNLVHTRRPGVGSWEGFLPALKLYFVLAYNISNLAMAERKLVIKDLR